MALVLPQDLKVWLSSLAERMDCSVEEALLEVLYQAKSADEAEFLSYAKEAGGDLWLALEREAKAKAAWYKRRTTS